MHSLSASYLTFDVTVESLEPVLARARIALLRLGLGHARGLVLAGLALAHVTHERVGLAVLDVVGLVVLRAAAGRDAVADLRGLQEVHQLVVHVQGLDAACGRKEKHKRTDVDRFQWESKVCDRYVQLYT